MGWFNFLGEIAVTAAIDFGAAITWILLIAVTASIQDYGAERATETGLPPAQIFIDAAGATTGTFLLFIAAVAQFFCGMASVTANSRMSYAFSRDNALPGSVLWSKVNPRTGTPTGSSADACTS